MWTCRHLTHSLTHPLSSARSFACSLSNSRTVAAIKKFVFRFDSKISIVHWIRKYTAEVCADNLHSIRGYRTGIRKLYAIHSLHRSFVCSSTVCGIYFSTIFLFFLLVHSFRIVDESTTVSAHNCLFIYATEIVYECVCVCLCVWQVFGCRCCCLLN